MRKSDRNLQRTTGISQEAVANMSILFQQALASNVDEVDEVEESAELAPLVVLEEVDAVDVLSDLTEDHRQAESAYMLSDCRSRY